MKYNSSYFNKIHLSVAIFVYFIVHPLKIVLNVDFQYLYHGEILVKLDIK